MIDTGDRTQAISVTAEASAPARGTRRTPRLRPGAGTGLLFIGPNLIGSVLLTVVPLLGVFGLAFTQWDLVSGLDGIEFVGLDNFRDILTDPGFWDVLGRTAIYAGIAVPASVLLGLALGLALNRDLPGRSLLRAIFFMPYIVNLVAIGMTWAMILNPSAGLVNQFLRSLGIDNPPAWFASSKWALPALVVIGIWSSLGYAALIYVAALQDMPSDLYEAASMDGAGAWRKFRMITWPALMPTTVFLLVSIFITISQSFGLIALITSGGPGDSTTTLSYYMYDEAFKLYHFGYASAVGLIAFAMLLALTLFTWRGQRGRSLHD